MKKTFPIFFLAIIITFLSIFYVKMYFGSEREETTLSKSFEFSGAKVVSSEIYFWGKIGNQYDNLNQLKPVADKILSKLDVLNDSSLVSRTFENDILNKVEISGVLSDNSIVNMVAQLSKKEENLNDRFISVKVTKDLSSSGLEEIRQRVLGVFDSYKIEVKVNSCITGTFDGKLDYDRLDEISRTVLKETEAKKVEGIGDNNFISVSAYTPNIGDYIKVNGKKVNLNLAVRYNSYENKTYIWLATPVITTEY